MKKIIESQITLLSHSGNTISPIRICYDDDEVEISLEYSGTRYQGMGTDFMWADAFWDLQRKLPDGTSLACCMTCRHGNMCPYGDVENQLFCTKDALITSKHDMIDLIDKTSPSMTESLLHSIIAMILFVKVMTIILTAIIIT